MNLQLFEKILGFTGIAFLTFGAVLAFFWKLDDAISKYLKDDLALHILLLDPKKLKTSQANVVIHLFNRVFGDRYFSVRCFVVSFLISTCIFWTMIAIMLINAPVHIQDDALSFHIEDEDKYALIFIFSYNLFIDYISIMLTRFALNKIVYDSRLMFLVVDLIATAALILGPLIIVSMYSHIFWLGFTTDQAFFEAITIMSELLSNDPNLEDTSLYFFSVDMEESGAIILFATTIFTSIWVWLAFLAFIFFAAARKSKTIVKMLQYSLPVEEKPLRSIGIVVAPIVGILVWVTEIILSFNWNAQ